jgi:hypothetical protein
LFVANRDSREDAIVKNAAVITSRLGDKLDDITSSVQKLLVADISELRGDEQLLQLLRDTVSETSTRSSPLFETVSLSSE